MKDKLLQETINYIENATQEQLDKDWEKLEKYSHIGHCVDDLIAMSEEELKIKENEK